MSLQSQAEALLAALQSCDAEALGALLSDDVMLRVWRWDGRHNARGRGPVVELLLAEWRDWPDAQLELLRQLADERLATLEFRVQASEAGRYIEHNRVLLLSGAPLASQLDIYAAEPLPSARRKGWIVPATLSAAELDRFFESFEFRFDPREWMPLNIHGRLSLRDWQINFGLAHPANNTLGAVRWSAEEADAKIAEQIEYYRQRGLGFVWRVGPYEQPADLGQRLERHGLILAGDELLMARVGLEDLAIPLNPAISVEPLNPDDEQAVEAYLQISARCFHTPEEQLNAWRPNFYERLRDPEIGQKEFHYVARLDGEPVAQARLMLVAGVAYLGGAATLPERRGRGLYSALLARRLEHARSLGYQIAAIHAGPMSRRVVSRYGFQSYARYLVYVWMEPFDPEVLRSLVIDD